MKWSSFWKISGHRLLKFFVVDEKITANEDDDISATIYIEETSYLKGDSSWESESPNVIYILLLDEIGKRFVDSLSSRYKFSCASTEGLPIIIGTCAFVEDQ